MAAHALGWLAEKLKQPPLIGEILAGVLLGPFVLAPALFENPGVGTALNFTYWFGLMLLMFLSGGYTHRLLGPETRRAVGWLLFVGTPIPFLFVLGLGFSGALGTAGLTGTAGNETATLLVLAIAAAVTSIPVISRIFHDLGILETRFASIVLGTAMIEDILLWGVLAVATALVGGGGVGEHVGASLAYTALGLTLAPALLKRAHATRWNIILKRSPVAYILLVMLAYAALAAALDVSLVFAAFLAGFGLVGGIEGTEKPRFAPALDAVSKVGFAFFIPVYFALVGYKLVLGRDFSLGMLAVFLIGSSLLRLLSVGLASRLAGFKGLDVLNLSVAANARGGPGIVLASVAYEKGIINAVFYTTLVLTALLTSQAAGAWLRFVLSRRWPLLSSGGEHGKIHSVHKLNVPERQ